MLLNSFTSTITLIMAKPCALKETDSKGENNCLKLLYLRMGSLGAPHKLQCCVSPLQMDNLWQVVDICLPAVGDCRQGGFG